MDFKVATDFRSWLDHDINALKGTFSPNTPKPRKILLRLSGLLEGWKETQYVKPYPTESYFDKITHYRLAT